MNLYTQKPSNIIFLIFSLTCWEFNQICKQKEDYNLQKIRKKVMQKTSPNNNATQKYRIYLLFEIETQKYQENSNIAPANPVIQLPPTTIFLSKRSLFRNEKERRQRGWKTTKATFRSCGRPPVQWRFYFVYRFVRIQKSAD